MAGIQIDGVNNKIDFDDDADTSISSATDDTLVVEVGGNTLATATSTSVTFNDGVTITTDDNTANLTLKSTDADASVGPILSLVRDSGSPADADFIGAVRFMADNDAGESIQFAEIDVQIDDASDGTEDGQLFVRSMSGGSTRDRIGIYGNNTVFNDGGLDIDFRIESENNANMFKIDAADDTLLIGGTGVNPATTTGENHTAFSNNGSMSISKNTTCIINIFF